MVAIVSFPLSARAAPITSSMAVVRPETVASMRDSRPAAPPILPVPLINGYEEIVRWEEAKEHRLARDLFICACGCGPATASRSGTRQYWLKQSA